MVTVLINHRVADYDAWQREYDAITSGPLGSAVRSHTIWRGLDDPNLVILAETYDSREAAEAAFAHPDLPAAIARAGVDMASTQISYLEQVGN